jgi:hypothetical protein
LVVRCCEREGKYPSAEYVYSNKGVSSLHGLGGSVNNQSSDIIGALVGSSSRTTALDTFAAVPVTSRSSSSSSLLKPPTIMGGVSSSPLTSHHSMPRSTSRTLASVIANGGGSGNGHAREDLMMPLLPSNSNDINGVASVGGDANDNDNFGGASDDAVTAAAATLPSNRDSDHMYF